MADFRIRVVVDAKQAQTQVDVVAKSLANLENRANRTRSALTRTLQFAGLTFVIRQLAELSEEFNSLQNRLRFVTKSQAELTATTAELLRVSNETRASFANTATLYARVAVSAKSLGVSQKQLITFTKALNQTIILSGATVKEAGASLIQLSQGLASGTLRGDELRSVLEQLPAVADIIAKELNTTRGALRAFAEQGKTTSKVIVDAFVKRAAEIQQAFERTVPTLAQSFEVLRNSVVAFVGAQDQAGGITAKLSGAMLVLANNVELVARVITTVLVAKALAGLVRMLQILNATLRRNPFAVLVGSIGLAIGALVAFGDKIIVLDDGITSLQDVVVSAFDVIVEAIRAGNVAVTIFVASIGLMVVGMLALSGPAQAAAVAIKAISAALVKNPFLLIAAGGFAAGYGIAFMVSELKKANDVLLKVNEIEEVNARATEKRIEIQRRQAEIARLNAVLIKSPENAGALERLTVVKKQLDELLKVQAGNIEALRKLNGEFDQIDRTQQGKEAGDQLAAGIEQSSLFTLFDKVFDDAQKRAADRAKQAASTAGFGDQAGEADDPAALTLKLSQLARERDLLAELIEVRGASGDALRIESELGISINEQQRERVQLLARETHDLKIRLALVEELNGPQEKLMDTQRQLNVLYREGIISLEQYNQKLAALKLAALEADTSISGGFQRGLLRVAQTIDDVGSLMESTLVNAFGAAEDALVDFVRTGTFEFEAFVNQLLDDIARLLIRLLILQAVQAATGTGATGAVLGSNIAGRAEGGPVQANRPFLVGEEGPELFIPPSMGSIVPADRTAGIMAGATGGGGGPVSVPAPEVNVSVVNTLDPQVSLDAMDTPRGHKVILNALQSNRKQAQRILS